ncbi:MAG: cytochrome c1 [Candidatus Hodgkinia cicadicola]
MLITNPNNCQIKRGLEVFRFVCCKCHSLILFKSSDLKPLGYTNSQASTLIETIKQLPSQTNRNLQINKIPPDLSLITKQTSPSFVYRLLTGYKTALNSRRLFFNKATPSNVTSMPPPLSYGLMKHLFKVPITVCQYAKDVAMFLTWVAEPWKIDRLRLFLPTFILLASLTLPLL